MSNNAVNVVNLFAAAAIGTVSGFEKQCLLLKIKDANIYKVLNNKGENVIHVSAESGNDKILRYLMNQKYTSKEWVNAKSKLGLTPLLTAAFASQFECCEVLLDYNNAGIDVNIVADEPNQTNKTLASVLHVMIINKSYCKESHLFFQVLDKLKSRGFLINHQDAQGDTALHKAVLLGQEDVVNWLIDNNINTRISNKNSLTALQIATAKGRSDIVYSISHRVPTNNSGIESEFFDLIPISSSSSSSSLYPSLSVSSSDDYHHSQRHVEHYSSQYKLIDKCVLTSVAMDMNNSDLNNIDNLHGIQSLSSYTIPQRTMYDFTYEKNTLEHIQREKSLLSQQQQQQQQQMHNVLNSMLQNGVGTTTSNNHMTVPGTAMSPGGMSPGANDARRRLEIQFSKRRVDQVVGLLNGDWDNTEKFLSAEKTVKEVMGGRIDENKVTEALLRNNLDSTAAISSLLQA